MNWHGNFQKLVYNLSTFFFEKKRYVMQGRSVGIYVKIFHYLSLVSASPHKVLSTELLQLHIISLQL